jgi:hypothetical protein
MDNKPVQRYSMDIRVFLAVITLAMAVSFTIGVGLGPKPPFTLNDPTQVHSVDLTALKKPSVSEDAAVYEPAGQVCTSTRLFYSSVARWNIFQFEI